MASGNAPSYELLKQLAIGGPALQSFTLLAEMFAACKMISPDSPDLLSMKHAQLSTELAARKKPKSGRKNVLQQRLREVMIRVWKGSDS